MTRGRAYLEAMLVVIGILAAFFGIIGLMWLAVNTTWGGVIFIVLIFVGITIGVAESIYSGEW